VSERGSASEAAREAAQEGTGEPYDQWSDRQKSELLAHIRRHRAKQRLWTWIGAAFLLGDVVAAAAFQETLIGQESFRDELLAAWGWLASLLFLALVAGAVSVWHQTRIREARYLLALLGSERGELIRNIVDAQTGKPAIEVDRGLWKVVDGELVKVDAVQEKKATES
jgi:hypothetical protein